MEDKHINEMTNINLSLHTLGRCISGNNNNDNNDDNDDNDNNDNDNDNDSNMKTSTKILTSASFRV